MPCYHPIQAWQSVYQNAEGNRPLKFKHDPETCGQEVAIGCGRCIGCRLERSRQWAVRCVHESQLHTENQFLTLTYNDENIPTGGSLLKSDFQKFMKRYRKLINPIKIRYYMCGEYGEKTLRPHYHAIIFGHEFEDQEHYKTSNNGDKLYRSKMLEDLWSIKQKPMGHCLIGSVTFESAAYVARYILKKVNGNGAFDHYNTVCTNTGLISTRIPEYTTMSRGRKPDGGIGKRWYDTFKRDLDKDFITLRGHKMRPPGYYDRIQEGDEPEIYELKKETRQEQQRIADKSDQSWSRLRVRENIQLKKANKLIRSYENDN